MPGIGQLCEFESPRVQTRIKFVGNFSRAQIDSRKALLVWRMACVPARSRRVRPDPLTDDQPDAVGEKLY